MPTELKEPAFGLDNFGKPKILKDTEAFATTVLMILFGKPGFLPSLPDVGMNIQQYTYAFFDEIQNVNNLEKTVNSLDYKYKENISIFITGFNSDLIL